jgi:hypothetical protein
MAINALIAKHWMLRYPTRSGSQGHRRNTVVLQHKERHFLPSVEARVSAPNIR